MSSCTNASSAAAAVELKNSNLFEVNQNFKNPYVESENLAIQRSLPGKFVLDVAYVGNHSVDTVVNYNLNAGTIAGAGNPGLPEFITAFGRTASTNLLFAEGSTRSVVVTSPDGSHGKTTVAFGLAATLARADS